MSMSSYTVNIIIIIILITDIFNLVHISCSKGTKESNNVMFIPIVCYSKWTMSPLQNEINCLIITIDKNWTYIEIYAYMHHPKQS